MISYLLLLLYVLFISKLGNVGAGKPNTYLQEYLLVVYVDVIGSNIIIMVEV